MLPPLFGLLLGVLALVISWATGVGSLGGRSSVSEQLSDEIVNLL